MRSPCTPLSPSPVGDIPMRPLVMIILLLALVALPGPVPAASPGDCPPGPEMQRCLAQRNDVKALTMLSLSAFVEVMDGGDLTEALYWAHRLEATGHPWGAKLLVMMRTWLESRDPQTDWSRKWLAAMQDGG